MTKFTKGEWQTRYMNKPFTWQGTVSACFGIAKSRRGYTITHLASGMMISLWASRTITEAKKIVVAAEAALDWSQGANLEEIAKHNGKTTREVADLAKSLTA